MERIERIIFSDFRLLSPFMNACKTAITHYSCGSLKPPSDDKNIRVPHSQGSTLECLINKMTENKKDEPNSFEIDNECKTQILRIAELQSEDFHLDRPLYFACREDREQFCRNVEAGEGRVFECLVQHTHDSRMNPACSKLLVERAQLVGEDFKMAHPLVKNCEIELKNYNCVPNKQALLTSQNYHLTQVLLCLENGIHMKQADPNGPMKNLPDFTPECKHEMTTYRSIMTSEFHMSPELVMNCVDEINNFCSDSGDIEKDGKTLHCLMRIAESRDEKKQVSPKCMNALGLTVKVVDIGSNYKVDKILMESCQSLLSGPCSNEAQSDIATLQCLMKHIDSPEMSVDCSDRLIEVQYFMARDWSLDPELYASCHNEAVKRCSASENWHIGMGKTNGPDPGPHVLACLYRAGYDDKEPLSLKCAKQIRRVLQERAVRVNLLPDIEENCRGALSEYCSVNVAPKEEMMCLQSHFETDAFRKNYPECYDSVSQFTLLESKDTKINRLLTLACRPVIKKYCQEFIDEGIDHGDVQECLLVHKHTKEMTKQCRSYVNHFELITLRDYHFSYNFANACQNDINKHCSKDNNSKGAIIRCLSNIVFEHKVLGNKLDISRDCKNQLKVQYLQQEQVNFDDKEHMEDADPELMEKCSREIKKLECDKEEKFEDLVECLREGYDDLGNDCKSMLFGREKIEAVDNTFDDELQNKCKSDINKFCNSENKERILPCLSNNKILRLLQPQCQKVVRERLMEQSRDIRLNPALMEACQTDAQAYCPDHFKLINNPRYSQQELQLILVTCLRENYISKVVHLSQPCKNEVSNLILESEFDIALDPALYKACKKIINQHCAGSIIEKNGKFDTVLECLKADFYGGAIKDKECGAQIARRAEESIVDINLDPILHQACDTDIRRYCRDTPPGDSRIITCLLDTLEVPRIKLSTDCKLKLIERKKLWSVAHDDYKMSVPETWLDLLLVVDSINNHPQRNSIFSFFGIFILIILIIGCCCGRCTKRTHLEMKNR
ncbi:Cysteine-rich Golgi apparatus protein 1 repeat and Cysteine-rich Golgi apparatus protein 1 repeat,eukaryote-containing protein [Strongyloides ratti]|uniref:Cysteine-rich Golgi apparatus protein 1 repeat and Cysteine-rich Golgi apparatus protein 1 repeat,eukaryote-containing protein n=1 Tax=Strongyloides ratti TaxID=34506 RepID=A0A090MP00_STRRB|nr:Cysteine-rich Golgi apparatus protein 1 repeat and Cysteine-rich Golgi apparatus protein 1 repeat,eukaryote-containing protein [Strongyloides ratti]CEF59806.1 Cysteine-rich Golgi apparatus protein 1 repeat and Cysteine-rich Golgi apparatus protein 1 repeat,eukaryote-containing protein [Strongyloides ratti]